MWKFDREKTKKRYRELSNLYDALCLNADSFNCKYYHECKSSQKKDVVKQFSGGTAALNPLYDVSYNGVDIRILIVGKEMGYMRNEKYGTTPNFHTNSLNVLNCIHWKRKNNQMKGVLDTLENIFNVHSEYVYASYCLSNGMRCSFQDKNSFANVSGVSDTAVMRKNCNNYLLREIEILQPTLIILQGSWSIQGKDSFLVRLCEYFGVDNKPVLANSTSKYGLYKLNNTTMCITSHHPAIYGHWKKNLAFDSLWPALDYLREIQFLPTASKEDSYHYIEQAKKYIDPIIMELPSNDRLRDKDYNLSQASLF